MIALEIVLRLHRRSIESYGGGEGLRDEGALLSAIARPFQTFDLQELYPHPVEKAAAIFESLIINHPFIDGNKRTAYLMLRFILSINGLDVMASEDEKYEMTIAASSGVIRFDEIKLWIEQHLSFYKPMILSAIAAISENHAIGKDNKLLWYLPNDLKHFKEITSGHTVIMGRKTFDSVGKPLPKRRNIVITRKDITIPGCEVVNSVEAALDLCKTEPDVFIVGGAEIYKLAMPLTNRIYLTIVHKEFDGDSFFPEISMQDWQEISREDFEPDEKNNLPYSFITYERQ